MPWTDERISVVNSKEKMNHVSEWVKRFAGRRYYPASPEGFTAMCEAVADIVWDKPEGHRWDKPEVIKEHSIKLIGNDLEWLMRYAFQRFHHCPSPRQLRAVYCNQGLRPADGLMISEEIED